jgi:hypothetical protein
VTLVAATRLVDVLVAASVGLAAVGFASAGLAALSVRQRRRVQSLAQASFDFEAMTSAALQARRDESELIRDVLRSAVTDVAADQQLADGLVTGAIFAPAPDGSFRIMEGQSVNLEKPNFELQVRPGETGVGEAIRTGKPVVTVFRAPLEESTIEDPEQRMRINPALRWIIAVPILAEAHRPLWVLSIAGLVEARSPEQLQSSAGHLLYYRELLELLLKGIAGKKK